MIETHDADTPQARRARGHHGLALGWLKQGRTKPAVAALRRAVEADPTYLEASLLLARVLFQQRRWHDLKEHCRQAFAHFMEIPEFHKMLITAVEELGSLDDAFRVYELEQADGRRVAPHPGEILCCVTVRNERARLPYFVDYYRRLGVDRFLFVDNGSDDGTDEWLLAQPDVHLWRSTLPFNRANFGSAWFELLLRRYGVGHWCVTVDADEFVIFEGSPQRSLRALCDGLDRRGKRVATGFLLDLYSDRPISHTVYREGEDPLTLCQWFDRKWCNRRLDDGGTYRNQTIVFGGVRERVFPTPVGYILSKAVVLRYEPYVVLTSGQHLTNMAPEHVAGEEICLLHFKFLSSFVEYARTEAARGEHAMGAVQYKAYDRELGANGELTLYDPAHSIRFEGTEQLRAIGIMRAEGTPLAVVPVVPAVDPVAHRVGRPFWSVQLTVYDRVHNIEPALRAVLAQASDDMEITVVCDRAGAECQQAAAAEVARVGGERVSFVALPERAGHPDVFNRCIELAGGQWVHILHDDDRVEPGFYAALRAVIDAAPEAGAAFVQHRVVHEPGGVGPAVWESWLERDEPGIVDDWLERIAVECRVQFSAMVVRRTAYETVGGFCAQAESAFDWEMWIRIAARHPVAFVPELLVTVGSDDATESWQLVRSGEQFTHMLAAIDVAAHSLPPGRAAALTAKARDRAALYALDTARACLSRGAAGSALALALAVARARPSPWASERLTDFLEGFDRAYRG